MILAYVPLADVLLRLTLTALMGFVLGGEREARGRPAGMRTTMLAAIAACAAMLVGDFVTATLGTSTWRPDPGRITQGILTGMGFLGAGTIMREGVSVRGLTTAATLWTTTIIGIAFGTGELRLGLIVFAFAAAILFVLPLVEHRIPRDWYGFLTVTVAMSGISDADVRARLVGHGLYVMHCSLEYDLQAKQRTMRWEVHSNKPKLFELAETVITDLAKAPGIVQVEWRDKRWVE